MRNIIFFSLLCTCAHASNGHFTGFSFGIAPGISAVTYKHHQITKDGKNVQWHNHGGVNFASAVSSHYLFPLGDSWVIGPELHGQYNVENVTRVTIPSAPLEENTARWNYGVACKLGYAATDDALFYILAGPERSYNQAAYHYEHPTVKGKKTENLWGFMGAFGAEQAIHRHFHLSEQLSYGWFDSISVPLSDGKTIKDQLRLFTGLIVLSYHH